MRTPYGAGRSREGLRRRTGERGRCGGEEEQEEEGAGAEQGETAVRGQAHSLAGGQLVESSKLALSASLAQLELDSASPSPSCPHLLAPLLAPLLARRRVRLAGDDTTGRWRRRGVQVHIRAGLHRREGGNAGQDSNRARTAVKSWSEWQQISPGFLLSHGSSGQQQAQHGRAPEIQPAHRTRAVVGPVFRGLDGVAGHPRLGGALHWHGRGCGMQVSMVVQGPEQAGNAAKDSCSC